MATNVAGVALDPAADDTWLVDHAVRERLHQVDGRPRTARQIVFALELLVLIACVPELGWWPLALMPVTVGAFLAGDRLMRRIDHAELVYAGAWSIADSHSVLNARLRSSSLSPPRYRSRNCASLSHAACMPAASR